MLYLLSSSSTRESFSLIHYTRWSKRRNGLTKGFVGIWWGMDTTLNGLACSNIQPSAGMA